LFLIFVAVLIILLLEHLTRLNCFATNK